MPGPPVELRRAFSLWVDTSVQRQAKAHPQKSRMLCFPKLKGVILSWSQILHQHQVCYLLRRLLAYYSLNRNHNRSCKSQSLYISRSGLLPDESTRCHMSGSPPQVHLGIPGRGRKRVCYRNTCKYKLASLLLTDRTTGNGSALRTRVSQGSSHLDFI